ncbi:MAG: response regulator, partial [Deltaproteobacteria bacterium]|nr:response regulator [Deltaproteobacteria bacterium]
SHSTAASSRRVLVVDDDADVRHLMRECLDDLQVQVHEASTAAEAQEQLATGAWDLVFLDLLLPDHDGRALLSQIRVDNYLADTPVIVMTALSASAVRNECLAYGVDGFIDKPLQPATIAPLAAATMDRRTTISRESHHDELTHIYNRWGFRVAFDKSASLCRRYGRKLTLGILDIDHFKAFNDDFGHEAGDQALRTVAEILGSTLRSSDTVGRWGGEEFVVAMPETDTEGAQSALAKVADELRKLVVPPKKGRAITFSAGVVEVEEGETLDMALLRADQRLIAAKQAGRDRIFIRLPKSAVVGGKPRLLVVEDDSELARLLAVELSSDYEVTTAGAAESAHTALNAFDDFAAVLLDHELPGRTGHSLLEELRAAPRTERLPIIILTASSSDQLLEKAFAAGASDYVVKPHRPRELLARLARAVGQRESER